MTGHLPPAVQTRFGPDGAVPEDLLSSLGRVDWVRTLPTKAKSTVLVMGCQLGVVVAKTAETAHLARERLLYESVLPALGVVGPTFRGWVDSADDSWLLTDFVVGRQLDLSRPAELEAVPRWVARMHAASASVALPPPLPRIGPEERLMLVSRALRVLSSSGTDCSEELSSCEMLQHLLPEVLAITDRLDPVLTHGDLSPQNLFHTPNGVVAIDWDKAGRAGPATDLSIIDPDVYCHEMRQLGRDTDRELTARAAIAGQVLAALNHDIVRKPLKKQRGYLERMLRAAQILAVEGKR